ncbi:MAG: phosphatidate cytidylyltransferase [Muribaculaceae bacterium]|nr:phosphatidate cytidylyltransferase [Muribaculaceae bacterium]
MKNVIVRSLTGIIYIGIIIGALLAGRSWMLALTLLFTLLAVDEFNRISDSHKLNPGLRVFDLITACLPSVMIYVFMSLLLFEGIILGIAYVACIIIRFIIPLYIKTDNPLAQTAHSMMTQLYVAWPLAAMLATYSLSPAIATLMFVMIWLNDTGAFCVGSLLGRHKLFERISPKKSWEGFFGGFIFAIAAGVVSGMIFTDSMFTIFSIPGLAVLGAVVSVMSTWGDLVESQIKRTLGIKDSGHLLPGHGGILDRIDSLLLVAPSTLLVLLVLYISSI